MPSRNISLEMRRLRWVMKHLEHDATVEPHGLTPSTYAVGSHLSAGTRSETAAAMGAMTSMG